MNDYPHAHPFHQTQVKYLPPISDEEQRRYLLAAMDRGTRWDY